MDRVERRQPRAAVPGSPWKGLLSYEAEDESRFFGRRQATAALVDAILARTLTILHAPSGAGKTSLLNAAVRPRLRREGWIVSRSKPGLDPAGMAREALLAAVLPSPETELRALAGWSGSDDAFAELLEQPADQEPLAAVAPASPASGAWLAALIRRAVPAAEVQAHFQRIARHASDPALARRVADARTPADYRAFIESEGFASSARALRESLERAGEGIAGVLKAINDHYALQHEEDVRLVLVLDQFEELFTLFVDADPGSEATEAADWRQKQIFFRDLRVAFEGAQHLRPDFDKLALRIVLSLREEYSVLSNRCAACRRVSTTLFTGSDSSPPTKRARLSVSLLARWA